MAEEKKKEISSQNYAGFQNRFLAAIIDVVVLGIIQGLLGYAFQAPLVKAMSWVLTLGYPPFMLYQYQATLGKMALKLKVVSEDGKKLEVFQILLREWAGKLLSGLVFCLGFIWVGFDEKKQGWHDKLARTLVVRETRK